MIKMENLEKANIENPDNGYLKEAREKSEEAARSYDFNPPSDKTFYNYESLQDRSFFEQKILLEKGIKNGLISPEDLYSFFRSTNDNGFKVLLLESCAFFSGQKNAGDCLELLTDEISNAFGDENENVFDFLNKIKEPEKSYLLQEYKSSANDILFNSAVRSLGGFGERGEKALLSYLDEDLLKEIDLGKVNSGQPNKFEKGIGGHQDFGVAYSRQTAALSGDIDLKNKIFAKDKEGDKVNFAGKWHADVNYPYSSEIFKQLAKTGTRFSVDFGLELLEKSQHSSLVYKEELENIFQNIDQEYAEKQLIALSGNGKEEIKNRALKMLFRLELKKIGIKKDNLNYLEEYYDSLPDDGFKKVFSQYGQIIGLSINAKENLQAAFKDDKEFSETEVERLSANLLKKANELLIEFGGKNKENISAEEVMKRLEKFKVDSVLTLSIFKTFKKEYQREDINFNDLKGVDFAVETAAESAANPAETAQMLGIYRANYADKPALREKIAAGFKEKLDNPAPGLKIYKMKKDGRILAFSRFEDMGGKKYFGSFNVAPEMQGSGIGQVFFQKTMEEEMKSGKTIEADCLADSPITAYYLGPQGGFTAQKINRDYDESGFDLINISKSEKQGILFYQNKEEAEMIKEAKNDYAAGEERFVLEFAKGSKEFFALSEKLFSEGYQMTRYFFSSDKKSAYGAFERKAAAEKIRAAA
jgi:hypothetical protein